MSTCRARNRWWINEPLGSPSKKYLVIKTHRKTKYLFSPWGKAGNLTNQIQILSQTQNNKFKYCITTKMQQSTNEDLMAQLSSVVVAAINKCMADNQVLGRIQALEETKRIGRSRKDEPPKPVYNKVEFKNVREVLQAYVSNPVGGIVQDAKNVSPKLHAELT